MLRKKLLLMFVLALVVVSTLLVAPRSAQAGSCQELPAYTDYYKGKPDGHPDADYIHAYFWNMYRGQWEYVPKNKWGIQFEAPQLKSGGWSYYFIASRWRYDLDGEHDAWNNDDYWSVWYCS